jgi:hypothetical protein
MNREELEPHLRREPFSPLWLHLSDRRRFDVPFNHVVVFRPTDIILFKGVRKAGSRVAKGYEVIPYEHISRVEQHRGGAGNRRKRPS